MEHTKLYVERCSQHIKSLCGPISTFIPLISLFLLVCFSILYSSSFFTHLHTHLQTVYLNWILETIFSLVCLIDETFPAFEWMFVFNLYFFGLNWWSWAQLNWIYLGNCILCILITSIKWTRPWFLISFFKLLVKL